MKKILFVCAFAASLPIAGFGDTGSFSTPQLGFPKLMPQATVEKVMGSLRSDFSFVKGSFINEFSAQHYSGSARSLSSLIQLLHDSQFRVRVTFGHLADEKATFAILQNSHRIQEITVQVNTANKATNLSDLTIELP